MNRNYIHDIKPTSRTHKRREALERERELRMKKLGIAKPEREEYEEPRYREPRSSSGRGLWYVAALAIVILVFALTYVFAGATVYVTPREGSVELSGPIMAEKSPKTGLGFQMLAIEEDASATIASSGQAYVEKKAAGTVRLFNNNPTAQKLLIDTRLTASDGKIYKTKVATTIPGQKIVSGKPTAGTIDVGLYADVAGADYNLAKDAELKVLGFKGGPKYTTVYGKTLTDISGGFKGQSSNVSDADLATQTDALKAGLKASLAEKARAELPADFIMYDPVSVVEFANPIITPASDGTSAEVKVHATMNAIIFKESELTKALVSGVVSEEDQENVVIPNIRDLAITLDPASAIGDPATMQSIKISIDDKVHVVWSVDDERLKEALSGIKKREFESVMLQFKNIDKAELGLKPFWKSSLPDKPHAIKIVNMLEVPEA
jgi:hypothetical protein